MEIKQKEKLWAEKYRPSTLEDLIIDSKTKSLIRSWIEKKDMPNCAFLGSTPGTGKTSLSKCIINDLEMDSIYINASKDNGIDMIRSKLQKFASQNSISGNQKLVLLDEADGLTPASQESLRGFIEEFSRCRFIITGNYKNKITDALMGRLFEINFDDITTNNKSELGKQMLERCKFILDNEKVTYEEDTIKSIIKSKYPSLRSAIITLQGNIANGVLTQNAKIDSINQFHNLISALASKNFDACVREVKLLQDPKNFYYYLFKNIDSIFVNKETSIAEAIMVIHDFLVKFESVRDPQISLCAFCATILSKPSIIINSINK